MKDKVWELFIDMWKKYRKNILLQIDKDWEKSKKRKRVVKEINFRSMSIPTKKRIKLHLNPIDDGFCKEFNWLGFREPLNSFFLYKEIRKGKYSVLDIGSNVGYFPIIETIAGASSVTCLEPVPLTFKYLLRNIRNFKNCRAINAALGTRNGKIKLYVAEKFNLTSFDPSSIIFHGSKVIKTITVPCYTLSSITKNFSENLILRMDIEGYEYNVLIRGVPDCIRMICLEFHSLSLGTKKSKDLLKFLDDMGFYCKLFFNDMSFTLFPLCNFLGALKIYKIVRTLRIIESKETPLLPFVEKNIDLKSLSDDERIKKINSLHLFLQR